MENVEDTHIERKHLVGIVPVSGHEKYDFNQPWPDCLMPIASGYSLIESSVVECAWAGCKSIWIVVNDDFAPIIRKKIGDWVFDPIWNNRKFDPVPHESRRRIPVFYVPVPMKHRNRRDCLSWSVIHGALTAFKLSSDMSRWTTPSKYYVSFPHSYVNPFQIREHRKDIAGPQNVYLTHNGESIKDGHLISFTFKKKDWLEFRRVVRSGTGRTTTGNPDNPGQLLPPEEQFSARWFETSKVFAPLDLDAAKEVPIADFFNIRSWEEYSEFIAASRKLILKRPKSVLVGTTYNRVAEDDDNEGQT
jgi:hypothetical protein